MTMTLAPERRWFARCLVTLLVVVTVSACVIWWGPWNEDPDEWISIAKVGDPGTAKAMVGLLTEKGIASGYEGSITYYVFVRRTDARRACQLIRDNTAELGAYQNWIADY